MSSIWFLLFGIITVLAHIILDKENLKIFNLGLKFRPALTILLIIILIAISTGMWGLIYHVI